METIGTLIHNAMFEEGYTQTRLKEESGLDQHYLSDIINNKKSPRTSELEIIAKVLKRQIIDFLPVSAFNISHNVYSDNASTIQNYNRNDGKLIRDLINEIVELRVKLNS